MASLRHHKTGTFEGLLASPGSRSEIGHIVGHFHETIDEMMRLSYLQEEVTDCGVTVPIGWVGQYTRDRLLKMIQVSRYPRVPYPTAYSINSIPLPHKVLALFRGCRVLNDKTQLDKLQSAILWP